MISRTRGVNCKKKQLIAIKNENGVYKAAEIHSKKDRPLWRLFIEYFNSVEIGEKFSRSDLLYATYEKHLVPSLRKDLTTIDSYRSYLRKLEIIEHVAPGIYLKKLNLPVDITLTMVRKATSVDKWKEWFIPLHEKLGLNESDLK